MSRNGNGHQIGSGNGVLKKLWDLKKDGILWKKVIEHSPQAFQKLANSFVAQLQNSVQPTDALQGLLLDRMAAASLRKQLLLEMEAMARLGKRARAAGGSLSAAEVQKPTSMTIQIPIQGLSSPEILRYESLLDQGFHRDLILLLKLKEIAPVPDTEGKKSLKTERGLIEGESIV
ncbi:MAG TPA: hypothetical protein VJP02_28375 [Candidatus Sulfotelmatobacter sp.]|nr:hypothetical protein [Candidatus Sulfotelmatobacter sp.]